MADNIILRICNVESVVDDADGLRIKARLFEDKNKTLDEIPFAFPLIPKMVQVVPKEGEAVLVILATQDNAEGNRFYIGPIISQPQFFNKDSFQNGKGQALSLLQGGATSPQTAISTIPESEGAFPDTNDIAIIGRKSEDITIKDGEIDLRCGIRQPDKTGSYNTVGNVLFNRVDPAYMQMKYAENMKYGDGSFNSVINLVADKINLIGNKSNNSTNFNKFDVTDKDDLINENSLTKIMDEAHPLPYGDNLVEYLTMFKTAFISHVHPYPGLPPCQDDLVKRLLNYNLNDLLSDTIRIN